MGGHQEYLRQVLRRSENDFHVEKKSGHLQNKNGIFQTL